MASVYREILNYNGISDYTMIAYISVCMAVFQHSLYLVSSYCPSVVHCSCEVFQIGLES